MFVQRIFRVLFWGAVAVTIYMTLRPVTTFVPGSDKTQHALTFGTLMALAAVAFPKVRLVYLGLGLSALGAAIEIAQPFFGRSRDPWDWVADSLGILVVLAAAAALRAVRGEPQRD